jgi:membrane-bound serine protease (ClpP class)
VGAIVAFLLGAFILFRPFQPVSPTLPDVEVSPWLIVLTTSGMVGFVLIVLRQIVVVRKSPVLTGYEHFIGQDAEVRHALQPQGRVWFQGQMWFARTASGQAVESGAKVQIVGLDDLTLIVEPVDAGTAPTSSV